MSEPFNTGTSHECSQDAVAAVLVQLMARFPVIKRIAFVVEETAHDDLIVGGAGVSDLAPGDLVAFLQSGIKYVTTHETNIEATADVIDKNLAIVEVTKGKKSDD